MSDKTELPKEDLNLIAHIDKLLGQLKTISQSVFELREHASLVLPDIAPIEQVEQPKEEVKERFSVEVYQPTLTGDEGFKINISPTFKMRKLMAEDIAHKIKALLQTL